MQASRNRTAIYLRCSTVQQNLDIQRNDLIRYAQARELEIIQVFEDHGVSGKKDSRAALDQLMILARQRKVDYLLVWRLDRLGRNTRHLLGVIDELQALQIALISHQEAIDLSTPIGRVMVTILSALSAFEAEILRERVVSGIEAARRRGKRLGRPQTVDREEVRHLRSTGCSYKDIQQRLGISRGGVYRALKSSKQGGNTAGQSTST